MKPGWWKQFFDEDYLRFHDDRPYQNTEEELRFLEGALGPGEGRRLLDVCCGPGRHSIGLARRGWRVIGLDRSKNLLRRARKAADEENPENRPRFVRADARRPCLLPLFDAAICMFTSIGYFESDAENFAVAKGAYDSLAEGGVFVLDLAGRDFVVRHPGPLKSWWRRGENEFVLEETRFDHGTSVAFTRNIQIDEGRVRESEYRVRLYSLHEIAERLTGIGFRIERGYGGYDGQTLTAASSRTILVGVK